MKRGDRVVVNDRVLEVYHHPSTTTYNDRDLIRSLLLDCKRPAVGYVIPYYGFPHGNLPMPGWIGTVTSTDKERRGNPVVSVTFAETQVAFMSENLLERL